jgi:hypothetical protein
MNKCGILCAAAGFALAVAVTPTVNAQRGFGDDPGPGFDRGAGFGEFHGQVTTGAPFSATRTVTHTQTLADGTTITHTNVIKEARDSQGRVFTQELPSPTGEGSRNRAMVRIFDPVSHTAITYLPDSKQANVLHLPEPGQFQRRRGPDGAGPNAAEEVGRFRGNPNMPTPTTESLGSKTINGVVAEGTRTTKVIPAGLRGNDKPITITHETWTSTDLKVVVMRVDTDPRMGTTTMELNGISRDEPAATLFQTPAGYTVNERTIGPRNGQVGLEPEP